MKSPLLVAVLMAGGVALATAGMTAEVQALKTMMQDVVAMTIAFVKEHQDRMAPIAFLLAFGESLAFISLLLPSTVILVFMASLLGGANTSHEQIFWVWLSAGVGGTLGYAVSYWIGWIFKDRIAHVWPFKTRPEMLAGGHRFFERWGAPSVFFGHFFGPVRAVIPVIAGSLGMNQATFQITNVIASHMWAAGVLVLPHWGFKFLAS